MQKLLMGSIPATCLIFAGLASGSDWLSFTNETASRVQADLLLVADDPHEKSYAWGDFDQDGDIDLAVARKVPMAVAGPKPNVLLMNEDGILVDRSAQFASASTVAGDQGFLTPTDDRDIEAYDLNGDGWLDLVTATTYGAGLPNHVFVPRIYINLGKVGGVWAGFKFEHTRLTMSVPPSFCNVGVGDVTGDDAPDLYFIQYGGPTLDILFVNDGNGFFIDESSRVPTSFLSSGFGTAALIHDFSGDGWGDIVKSEAGPLSAAYNNGAGQFSSLQTGLGSATYHVSMADMNNDGRMDLLASDDGTDRLMRNTATVTSGQVNWQSMLFPGSTSGFGSNSYGIDINNDNVKDYFVASVDVRDDPPMGCTNRVADICRGQLAGGTYSSFYDVANIPENWLTAVFDWAVFDINGDCW
jgi:hypothetical protein